MNGRQIRGELATNRKKGQCSQKRWERKTGRTAKKKAAVGLGGDSGGGAKQNRTGPCQLRKKNKKSNDDASKTRMGMPAG